MCVLPSGYVLVAIGVCEKMKKVMVDYSLLYALKRVKSNLLCVKCNLAHGNYNSTSQFYKSN